MGFPLSGQDADGDGVDDACDADPSNPAVPGISQSQMEQKQLVLLQAAQLSLRCTETNKVDQLAVINLHRPELLVLPQVRKTPNMLGDSKGYRRIMR